MTLRIPIYPIMTGNNILLHIPPRYPFHTNATALSMASTEHPLKKRKIFRGSSSPPTLPDGYHSFPPLQASQVDILKNPMTKEEIKNMYECYKRIGSCMSKKNLGIVTDFDKAYNSFIASSRGCTSVQRIVAEHIPQYASFCPTALDAAAKASINMHNWTLPIIMKGDDGDSIAYQTAKACIFGLVEICLTASSKAQTSSVLRGICSTVHINVLKFFTSSMVGNDDYRLSADEIARLLGTTESFSELKQEQSEHDEPMLSRLFKYRVFSLLRIFICCPRSSLASFFELLNGTHSEDQSCAEYFLCQVTNHLITDDIRHVLGKNNELGVFFIDEVEPTIEGKQNNCDIPTSDVDNMNKKKAHIPSSCLMKMLIVRDPSLSCWMHVKYKRLCTSVGSMASSELSSTLDRIFGSPGSDFKEDNDDDNFDSLELINHPYMFHRSSKRRDKSSDLSGEDDLLGVPDASTTVALHVNSGGDGLPGQLEKPSTMLLPCEINDRTINDGLGSVNELSRPNDNLENVKSDDRMDPKFFKANFLKTESELKSTSTFAPDTLPSSKQNFATDQSDWYYDRDAMAMDVFSASKLLWLSPLGYDLSETEMRLQFEDFGSLEKFSIFPANNFALIEYRNIMDSVRAREYMQGSSHWGGHLNVKFLDIGLGSRGVVNGTGVGDSCYVYVGKIFTQRAKDELLFELSRVVARPPVMVTELTSANALLLEFVTSEAAAIAMTHIRRKRNETGYGACQKNSSFSNASRKETSSYCQLLVRHIDMSVSDEELVSVFSGFGDLSGCKFMRQIGCCLMNFRSFQEAEHAKSHLNGARFGPTCIRVEIMTDSPGHASSPSQTVPDSSTESSKLSHRLSSLFASLCTKYNIIRTSGSNENHKRKYCSSSVADHEQFATSTLFISFSDTLIPAFNDDELMEICSISVGNVGSVIRLIHPSVNASYCFVEFSSKDAAITAFNNIRKCPEAPELHFQIEFRNPSDVFYHNNGHLGSGILSACDGHSYSSDSKHGNHYSMEFQGKQENISDLISPGMKVETFGTESQNTHAFQSNWGGSNGAEGSEPIGKGKEGCVISHGTDPVWQYRKPEIEPQMLASGNLPRPPSVRHGGAVISLPPPIQTSFITPAYVNLTSSWNGLTPNNNVYNPQCAPVPFIPSSITPLSQLQGNSIPPFEHTVAAPPISPPPLPPPLPMSQPPPIPPPPSGSPPLQPPPPQTHVEQSNLRSGEPSVSHSWLGALCKSGVLYCTIYAIREDLDVCNYSCAVSEPADWPAKLDVTKRTDFRHVKATFTSTPPHKREVCQLLPSSSGDHKGFRDFISYLKQRECAGVIKIPAGTCRWPRLLFILPCSKDVCSLLSILPNPSECLIALVLPKEINPERM